MKIEPSTIVDYKSGGFTKIHGFVRFSLLVLDAEN